MKPVKIIVAVVIVAVLGAGGYLIFHNMQSNSGGSTATNSSSSSSKSTANLPSVNNAVLATKTSASLGKYLTDPGGKPLYTYGADTSGVSNCNGACIATWPAYQPTSSVTTLPAGISTIKRSDGKTQYTYNGMPLYYFADDHGSTPTGDGVANFSLARPAAASSQAPATSTNTSTGSYSNPY